MSMTAIILAAAMSTVLPAADQVRWFPGSYFDVRARDQLQRAAMERWPGPGELLRLWRKEELSEKQRLAILLGGAAFHDPQLLPVYREAIASDSQRLRQGAAYGFRDLMADLRPNVTGGVDDDAARLLGEEMDAVADTLRRHSLLGLWLQSALVGEESSLPGWSGVYFDRAVRSCLEAAERVAYTEDLDLLVTAYGLAKTSSSRIALMQLIEGVALDRFIVMPLGQNAGWGPEVFTRAMRDLDAAIAQWSHGTCTVDGEAVLRTNLRRMGVGNVDPLGPDGCGVWLEVLGRGPSAWWMMAARRLYACGGPWIELSTLDRDREKTREGRERLLTWYNPPHRKALRPSPHPRPSEP